MTAPHPHKWLEETHAGRLTCLVCGLIVDYDHRETTMPKDLTHIVGSDLMSLTDATDLAIMMLKNAGVDVTCGACMEVAFTGMTTNQHTCKETNMNDARTLALKALEAIQWNKPDFEPWSPICLWCHGYKRSPAMDQDYNGVVGHKPNCIRQRAITALKLLP